MTQLASRALLLGLTATALVWSIAYLTWPFTYDQGAFAWAADVILRGGLPYRDAFDVKGPMSFYPSVLVQAVAGANWWGIRLFDLALVAACATLIGRVVARVAGRDIGWGTAILWVLAYANIEAINTAQPDGWVGWLMLLAIAPLLLSDAPVRPRDLALSGACVALATLLKPFYAAFILIPALALWVQPGTRRERARGLALVAVAFTVPVLAAIAAFALHSDGLAALWDAYVRFNIEKNSSGFTETVSSTLSWGFLRDPLPLLTLPLAVAGVVALSPGYRRLAVLLGAWLAIAIAAVLIQRAYLEYRLLAATPVLFMLAGAGFAALVRPDETRKIRHRPGAMLAVSALLLVCIGIGRHPLGLGIRGLRYLAGGITYADYYRGFGAPGTTAFDESAVTAWLRAETDADVRVWAWDHPAVAVLAHRRPALRLSISTPVNTSVPPEVAARYWRELAASLAARPPDVIVIENTVSASDGCLACLPPYTMLGDLGRSLAAPYRLAFQSGHLAVYRRAPAMAGGE